MRFVPGPDLPTGGRIVGLEGIREAYETGRGIFRTRATATIEQITPRRTGIVVTELPYSIGPEKVITRIKDLVQAKKLNGIADLKDLTDRHRGLHLVIEVRSGFNPEAVLAELYRLTPMEETFGINNVALVDGQPRVLGPARAAGDLRRAPARRDPAPDRVPAAQADRAAAPGRRPADRAAQHRRGHRGHPVRPTTRRRAKSRLMDDLRAVRDPGAVHPGHAAAPADPLRPARARAGAGRAAGRDRLADGDPGIGRASCASWSAASWPRWPRSSARRGARSCSRAVRRRPAAAVPLEVADDPCVVLMSATGLVARVAAGASLRVIIPNGSWFLPRLKRLAPPTTSSISAVRATVRGTIGLVTSAGRLVKLNVLELPAMPPGRGRGVAGRAARR